MGIADDLHVINKELFMGNKRKQDKDLFEVEYGSFQVLIKICQLLEENNNLLKTLNDSLKNPDVSNVDVQEKRNAGLQKRNKG